MPNGELVEVWLKAPHLHEGISDVAPSREWMSAKLAEDLNLPCPPPALVRITGDFLDSLSDGELADSLGRGPSVVYGAMHLGAGWRRWTDASSLPRSEHQLQGRAYLFDTIIQNWDRRIANPNILKKGDEFRLIDHEEAYGLATGPAADKAVIHPPWTIRGVNNFVAGDFQHPFWRTLRASRHVDFKLAASDWKKLPTNTFSLYAASAPPEWGATACNEIAAYLSEAVNHVDDIVAVIEGARSE